MKAWELVFRKHKAWDPVWARRLMVWDSAEGLVQDCGGDAFRYYGYGSNEGPGDLGQPWA